MNSKCKRGALCASWFLFTLSGEIMILSRPLLRQLSESDSSKLHCPISSLSYVFFPFFSLLILWKGLLGFPDSSVGKESCSAGGPSSISGLGISTEEGIGYPLLCGSAGKESACTAGDLGWDDHLEKGKATHSSILAWRIP